MMDKKIVQSEIAEVGGVPSLIVNGEVFPTAAYMTYLEEYNDYASFAREGYRLFSVPVLFSGRWISVTEGFKPFKKGIFDIKNHADFTLFDEAMDKILEACPEALVFPRVNVSMPLWWEKENPMELNIKNSKPCRESFYSEKWLSDVSQMVKDFVNYVENSPYASHVVGYQLAGGNTEEWFHFDMNAGFCKNAEKGFGKFLENNYPHIPFKGLPDITLQDKKLPYFEDEYLTRFFEYASFAVANAVTHLASVVKKELKRKAVVGAFYGYSLEVTIPFHGTHMLKILLEDENIDFICSPNSYIGVRNHFSDWSEMYTADSVRLHGKMCFQECDIRTHLTVPLCEKDLSYDPLKNLTQPIWYGLENKNQTINLLRKVFSRQLIKGNGFWWFDMWGGWYSDREIMKEMKRFREIYSFSLKDKSRKSLSEVAVFVDEGAYKYLSACSLRNVIYNQRHELGLMGAPYDMYDIFDFEKVKNNYKAFIFMSAVKTDYMLSALSFCEKEKIPYISVSEEKEHFSTEELRGFLSSNAVKSYCESDDIVYVNENFISIFSTAEGEKRLKLYQKRKITDCFSEKTESFHGGEIKIHLKKGEIKLYRLD